MRSTIELIPCKICEADGNESLRIERLQNCRSTVIYSVICSQCGEGFAVNVDCFAEPYDAAYEMWNKVMAT